MKHETMEERFNERFVRDDGLMDKYHYDGDGNPEFMSGAVKDFVRSECDRAAREARQEALREVYQIAGKVAFYEIGEIECDGITIVERIKDYAKSKDIDITSDSGTKT